MATTKSGTPKPPVKSANARPAPKAAPRGEAKTAPVAEPDAVMTPAPVVASATAAPLAEKVTVTLKLKELIEQVVQATGGKKKGVKEIVEATLASVGDALSKGHDLHLPPLGKAKVGRQKDKTVGELLIVKLHRGGARGGAGKGANQALADAND